MGSAKTFYLLNKSRVGKIARVTVCFINTGSFSCDANRWVPFIWSKLVHSADGPLLRRDLQRITTSFPTFRFYVPTDRGVGLREFPLVQQEPLVQQTPDPNLFINNPEDSNAN